MRHVKEAQHKELSFSFDSTRTDLFAEAHKNTMTMPSYPPHSDLFAADLPAPLLNPYDAIANLSVSQGTALKSRDELETFGQNPEQALPGVMSKVRVLGMGETHIADNPQRNLGTKIMTELKMAGATHLAIEMDQGNQKVLDQFMKSGDLNPKDLPEKLQTNDYVDMLKSARTAGLKIEAVDDHFAEEMLNINRNQAMAAYVGQILEQSPQNKVVFWVGSAHLTNFSDNQKSDDGATSAQILSQKYSVATVIAKTRLHSERTPLEAITPDLKKPVLLKTSQAANLRTLREDSNQNPKTWLKNYDYVIDFPEANQL